MMLSTMAGSPVREKDITVLVTCERCSSWLETALSKDSTKYDFTLRVTPCSTCEHELAENVEPSIQSIQLVLNDSERESVSVI